MPEMQTCQRSIRTPHQSPLVETAGFFWAPQPGAVPWPRGDPSHHLKRRPAWPIQTWHTCRRSKVPALQSQKHVSTTSQGASNKAYKFSARGPRSGNGEHTPAFCATQSCAAQGIVTDSPNALRHHMAVEHKFNRDITVAAAFTLNCWPATILTNASNGGRGEGLNGWRTMTSCIAGSCFCTRARNSWSIRSIIDAS